MRRIKHTKELKLLLPAIVLILLATNAFGLGIARSFNEVSFVPNQKVTLQYYVYNDEHKAGNARIELDGSLENRTEVEPDQVRYKADEELIPFTVKINLPEKIEGSDLTIMVQSEPMEFKQITGRIVVVQKVHFAEKKEIIQPLNLTVPQLPPIKETVLPSKVSPIKTTFGKVLLYVAIFATLINVILFFLINRKKREPFGGELLDQTLLENLKNGFESGLPEEIFADKLVAAGQDRESVDKHLNYIKGGEIQTRKEEVRDGR